MANKDYLELYTCKFEAQLPFKSAQLSVVVSAQKGTVEDVNEGMNVLAVLLRGLRPVEVTFEVGPANQSPYRRTHEEST